MSCVDSIAAEGQAQLTGNVTLSAGEGIALTQAGQDIEIALDVTTATEETAGAVTATSLGTTLTANAGANTKGSYSQLIAATGADSSGFIVLATRSGNGDASFLVDIATGAGGAEAVLVPNMLFRADTLGAVGASAYIPLPIASGTRVAARCQSSTGGATIIVEVLLITGGLAALIECAQVQNLGAVTADSGGVNPDVNNVANTKGPWSQLTAATTIDIRALAVLAGADTTDTVNLDFLYDIGTGAGGAEAVIVANMAFQFRASQDNITPSVISPLPITIPSGTRVAMRGQANSSGFTVSPDFVLLGFGP